MVAEMDLGTASCSDGVPLGRTALVMLSKFWVGTAVMVTIALGVGGAKPPWMPEVARDQWLLSDRALKLRATFLETEREFRDRHDGRRRGDECRADEGRRGRWGREGVEKEVV